MNKFIPPLLVILILAPCTRLTGQAVSTKKVISVKEFELRDHVDTLAFEKFMLNELGPIYNAIEGQQFTLVRGDRGKRKNKYAVILQFDNFEVWNRIYPEKGKSTVKWGGTPETWQKFIDMTIDPYEESKGTSYVEIVH